MGLMATILGIEEHRLVTYKFRVRIEGLTERLHNMADTLILFINSVLIGIIGAPRFSFLAPWQLKEYKGKLHKYFFIGLLALISLLITILGTWLLGNIFTVILPNAIQYVENPSLTIILSFLAWIKYYRRILKEREKG